jgi:hypothetical protein
MAYYVSNVLVKEVPATPDASRGAFLMSTGTSGTGYGWAYIGGSTTGIAIDNSAWRYRSIYTHGYIACGYKGSNPWRSVNKTWHPTDTTFYCGEQIMNTQSYTNGTWSDYNGYIVANGGMSASGSVVASYGLHNGTCRMYSGDGYSSSGISYDYVGNDPKNEGLSYGSAGFGSHVGGMRMDRNRVDPCCAEDIKGQSGWIVGGGSSVTSRLNFTSEVMYAGWDSGTDGIGDGASGELRGWFAWPATYRYVTWSNSTWSGTGVWGNWSRDGQCNTQSTKYGWHYIGNGSNVTSGKSKFRDSDGVTLTNFNKVRAYGEENVEEGQDWGYIMGHYDGQQNNHTIKQDHSTDTEVTMGATCMPKGHYGQSSGACSTAAATVTASGVGM